MGANKDKNSKAVDCGKYARYTQEQVDILERVYNECPKPSSSRRQQLIRECPILANIGQKQLKVWFQNRRCREKQRKETCRLQNWNSKLNAMNQILLEENERLQKQAAQLSSENQSLRQQLQLHQLNADSFHPTLPPVITTTTDTSSESVVTNGLPQQSPQHPSQECLSQLSVIAERCLAEFLAKITRSEINGIPLPGMKPGPDSIGAIALSCPYGRVAAQACGFIALEPMKVSEIVKSRPLWLQDCRKLDVLATFEADRGGLVELVHTEMYAPTSLVRPWEFWTVRYTCCLQDGSLVVCERSLSSGQSLQEISITPGCLCAEMLPSGCLIRTLGQRESMILVMDDISFKSGSSRSEGGQPLFVSSAVLANRMTSKILHHLCTIVKERDEIGLVSRTSALQGFNNRLVRCFNDAINCFEDEGWISVVSDGSGPVNVQIKPFPVGKQFGILDDRRGGIICVRASFLLPSIPILLLFKLLEEQWATWADFDTETWSSDKLLKRIMSLVQVLHSPGQDEVLKVVRLRKIKSLTNDDPTLLDHFWLEFTSGLEDITASGFAQLIFSPIDASVPDDAPLLPSGFRIVHVDGDNERTTSAQTLDLASNLEDRVGIDKWQVHRMSNTSLKETSSVLMVAFQCMYEAESQDIMALKAQRHVQALLELIQHMAISLQVHVPITSDSHCGFKTMALVQQIVDSYRFYVGQELLMGIDRSADTLYKNIWAFRHAIICCVWKPLPEFIFANKAALEMLETRKEALRDMSLEQMFNDAHGKTDYSRPPPFIQTEGYARLPAGMCLTSMGQMVSFEHAIGWKVITANPSVHTVSFMFCNWSLGSGEL